MAALAHHADAVPARLSVPAARRHASCDAPIPRDTALLRDRPNHHVLWPVARGGLEFRPVGRLTGCCDGVCGAVVEIPSVTAGPGGLGRHVHVFRCDVGFLPLAESGICIQLPRHHAILPRWLAGGGRRCRATVGSSGGCGWIIRTALDRVPFATAWRSSHHAPSRGAGQSRLPVGRRAATGPDPRDQCEPIHLFSVLDSRHAFLPFVPEGLSFCPLSLWWDAGITGGGFWAAIDRGDAAVANPACGAAHSRPTRQGFRFRINSWRSRHLDDRTSGAPTTDLTRPTRRRA